MQGTLYFDYHSKPLITINKSSPPPLCGNVLGDCNCLYRAVCLSISDSKVSFEQIKQFTAKSIEEHRRDFAKIDDEHINDLIESALTDGDYGEKFHLFAFSSAFTNSNLCV